MYPKNAASPEPIAIGPVVQISDGAVQTSGCTVRIKPIGVAEADGGGTTAYSTDGVVLYTPTQAETNYTSFVLIAKKTGCIPASITVITTSSATPGTVLLAPVTHTSAVVPTVTTLTGHTAQTGDSYAIVNSGTHGNAAIKGYVDDIGAAGAGLTAVPWNAAWDAEVQSEVQDAIEVNHLDHLLAADYDPASKPGVATALLNELIESDAGVSRYTANALEQAPTGGSAPTVGQIADEVQTRTIAAVTLVNGLAANTITASALAADAVTEIQSGLSTLTQTQVTGGAYALNSASFAFNAAMDFTTTQKAATLARVTLTDTVTTYTGNTPQTGDAYAVVSNGTHGNAALKTLVDDVPTVAEFEERTIVAASYFDPAVDKVYLGDGAQGGSSMVLTAERIIVASATLNEPAIKATGNGTAPGIHGIGGATGDGICGQAVEGVGIQGLSTNGYGMAGRSINDTGFFVTSFTCTGTFLVSGAFTAAHASNAIYGIQVDDFTTAAKALLQTEANDALVANHLDHLLAADYDPASKPGVATALLNELIGDDLGVSQFTANALELAPTGGSAPTVGQIADEVQTRTIAAVTLVNGLAANTITASALATDAVTEIFTAVLTSQLTESYAADGVAPTLAQAVFLIQQAITEFTISGTTTTIKKLDGSTTAATLTLNDGTTPTGVTRAT